MTCYVLDTNVLSALMNREAAVEVWARRFRREQVFTTAITQAEMLYGLALLPEGRRKAQKRALAMEVLATFSGRILPFDVSAADHYARIAAWRKQQGRMILPADVQIAAITMAHGGAVVTRNVRDFVDCGVEVIDPWVS